MIKKIFKYVGIATICLVVVALSSALLYRKYRQNRVSAEHAIHSPNGIDSLEAVQIGGIKQWIEVRGQDVNNPILLFIHGGPGIAFIPVSGSFQVPWEQHFTVVQWDQRGAGKTYASNGRDLQRNSMTVPQMEEDTVEVVNYLSHRFGRQKIFVLGHSWGSVLGLWLAHEHPDLIYAYIGVGQFLDMKQSDALAYRDALQEATSTHNLQAIRELEAIAPYPPAIPDNRKGATARYWEEQLLGPPPSPDAFTNPRRLMTDVISAPQYSLADDLGFIRGLSLSFKIFSPQIPDINLHRLGTRYSAPIFFFEGRQDPYCRPSMVWDYYQTIEAPQKEFIWFNDSGHFPFFEDKQRFAGELFRRVLPLATKT